MNKAASAMQCNSARTTLSVAQPSGTFINTIQDLGIPVINTKPFNQLSSPVMQLKPKLLQKRIKSLLSSQNYSDLTTMMVGGGRSSNIVSADQHNSNNFDDNNTFANTSQQDCENVHTGQQSLIEAGDPISPPLDATLVLRLPQTQHLRTSDCDVKVLPDSDKAEVQSSSRLQTRSAVQQ